MIVAVDFDGTIADHCYPDIGGEVPRAFHWMKEFVAAGAKLLLWTIRSDGGPNGVTLADAVAFCRERGVEFWGVNENPTQSSWSSSPKAYAHIYIDDAGAGCPLRANPRPGGRPFVDWDVVGPIVMARLNRAA